MKKHLTYTDEKSSKFWSIETRGNAFTVTFGKIGTAGTSQTKTWNSEEQCQKEAEKLLADKLKKGYMESDSEGSVKSNLEKIKEPSRYKTMAFKQVQSTYKIDFLQSSTDRMLENETLLVFEEDAYFTNLEIDTFLSKYELNIVLFCKNLKVEGNMIQQENDYGPTVIVMGNVEAKNIWCGGGEFYFYRNVIATHNFIAGVYNHGYLEVRGDIQAELIMSSDHDFSFKTISKGIAVLDNGYSYKTVTNWAMEDAIAPKYIDYNYIDFKKIYEDVIAGKTILKSKNPITPYQKRLLKAEKNGYTKLDLSGLGMKVIPNDIFQFENLKELDLSLNDLTNIPADIAKLTNLEKLSIKYNVFEVFPEAILELKQLTYLDMSGIYDLDKIPPTIAKLQTLKTLKLYDASIVELPDAIWDLENLEELNIGKLWSLTQHLTISKSHKKLKKLDISSTPIAQFSGSFSQLIELDISYCELTEIPMSLFECSRLKKLRIEGNTITAFNNSLKGLSKLKELHLTPVMKDVEALQHLNALKSIWIKNSDFIATDFIPTNFIEGLLAIPTWTELIILDFDIRTNDQFILEKILKRKNLKELGQKPSWVDEYENFDIKKYREFLNIQI